MDTGPVLKGGWTMQTKGFAYNLQGSVPGAGLAWNLVFWRQTLSIVGGWRVLVETIPRSCRHTVPDLTIKTEVKDRDRKKLIIAICLGLLEPFQTIIVCPEIKQKQAQDRKTHFETVSLPVAKILSLVARHAPTKHVMPKVLVLKAPGCQAMW